MRRYTITLGAPSTSGGKVISASSDGKIDGLPIALEGDLVTCPVCKTAGKILCVGPRIPETWGGKNVALENDLCICRCASAPRLLPNQTMRCQVIKDTGRALSNPGAGLGVGAASNMTFTDRFALVDEHDGSPLSCREYAVVRASGKLEFGTSDAFGQTHLLSTTSHAECVEIYVQGVMTAASLISPSGVVLHHRARRNTTPAAESAVKEVRVHRMLHGPRPARLVADEAGNALHDAHHDAQQNAYKSAGTQADKSEDELVVFLPEGDE